MAVAAHHQEIAAAIGGRGEDGIADVDVPALEVLDVDADIVAGKMEGEDGVRQRAMPFRALVLSDGDDVDRLGADG
jgi:hypothetical protein